MANCGPTVAVGDLVRFSGDRVGNTYTVSTCNPLDANSMPATGVVVKKRSATLCVVQCHGPVRGVFAGLEVGGTYFVGLDFRPALKGSVWYPDPGDGVWFQVVGAASASDELLFDPLVPHLGAPFGARVFREPVVGVIDGSNAEFSVSGGAFIHHGPYKESVYLNGVLLSDGPDGDYTVAESTPGGGFDRILMWSPPVHVDSLVVDYTIL